jgi:hypothetical protein
MKGKYQFIFDLENQGHFDKLKQMLSQSAEYRIFVSQQAQGTHMA